MTSIKGALGECGASSAASRAAAVLCGAVGEVPPIVALVDADDRGAGSESVPSRRALPGPIALVNAVGSGGSLFSVVLRVNPA